MSLSLTSWVRPASIQVRDLTDFSSNRYMTQGRFIMESLAEIETCVAIFKNSWFLQHFSFWGASGAKSWTHLCNSNFCRMGRRRPASKRFSLKHSPGTNANYLTFHHVRIWHKAILWWGKRRNRDSGAAGAKNTWPRRHSHNESSQTPSNKPNPSTYVKL